MKSYRTTDLVLLIIFSLLQFDNMGFTEILWFSLIVEMWHLH